MNGSGYLAACPRHATVGHQRNLVAAILQHPERGAQSVQFRHAIGHRSLETNHDNHVLKGLFECFLIGKNPGRSLNRPAGLIQCTHLDGRSPEIAGQQS